jgi:hypothetical protein
MRDELTWAVVALTQHFAQQTNSVKQRPAWQADSRSTGKEIFIILYNPTVHNHNHNIPPLDPPLSHFNSVHILTPYLSPILISTPIYAYI